MKEVVAELDGSDFEDSEDDFDGYLDMESDNDAYTNETRDGAVEGDEERTEKEDVRTNIERGSDCSTEQSTSIPPKYTLQPWQFSCCECHMTTLGLVIMDIYDSTHKDHSKTPSGTSARRYSQLAAQRSMHSTTV